MITWNEVPNMAKWIVGVVAGFAAIGTVVTWGASGYEHIHTQPEADAMQAEIEQHHNQDLTAVYQMLANEKRADRVQRNQRELVRLERDLVGGKYANEDERQFMMLEIEDLKAAIHCDVDGICSK